MVRGAADAAGRRAASEQRAVSRQRVRETRFMGIVLRLLMRVLSALWEARPVPWAGQFPGVNKFGRHSAWPGRAPVRASGLAAAGASRPARQIGRLRPPPASAPARRPRARPPDA